MQHLTQLVDQGILMEDEFIELYLKVVRDEGFIDAFGAHADEARTMLTSLIEESRGHKAGLVKLKESLS
ncbi:hypothetical protein L0Y59_02210 [Candidatus Uhrbacteria bacterium]|nr:hypothetical protein [Candidatus Uhrbacteria bacterium]